MRALAAINKKPSKIKMFNSYSLYIKGKDKPSNYIYKLKRNFSKERKKELHLGANKMFKN